MKMKGITYIVLLALLAGATGCVKQEQHPSERIPVRLSVEEAPLTKANPHSHLQDWKKIRVNAWSDATAATGAPDFMAGEAVLLGNDGYWEPEQALFWPSGTAVKIVGYAPAELESEVTGGTTYIEYIVPGDVAAQKPLLTGTTTRAAGADVHLSLHHRLTALQFGFKTAVSNVSVEKITLSGVYGSGRLDAENGTWSNYGFSGSFSVQNVFSGNLAAGQVFLSGDNTFIMIPQAFATGSTAQITVNYSIGGEASTMTFPLEGSTWEAGTLITYFIRSEGGSAADTFTFEVTQLSTEKIPSAGTSVADYFSIKSTRTLQDGTEVAWPWNATEYYYDGNWQAAPPSWLKDKFTSTADPSLTGTTAVNYPMAAADNTLAETPEWATYRGTSDNAVNLAMLDIYGRRRGGSDTEPYETANCYVVSGPGWYKIPAVYGNGYKNGAVNAGGYSTTVAPGTFGLLSEDGRFVRHDGQAIAGPWITKAATDGGNGITPHATAPVSLVWQDAQNLIRPESLSYKNHYVHFEIRSADIARGNAVIALKDASGDIVWSWHIWVTDNPSHTLIPQEVTYFTETDVTTSPTAVNRMLPVNLGFTPGSAGVDRWCIVRFTQRDSDLQGQIYVVQRGPGTTMGAPYYQWGRKDPMWPSEGTAAKTIYNADGTTVSNSLQQPTLAPGSQSLAEAIKRPSTFFNQTGGTPQSWPGSLRYDNLWNTALVSAIGNAARENAFVVKSVYDPCPPGFKVPGAYAFSGFHTTSMGSTAHNRVYGPNNIGTGTDNDRGLFLYCHPADDAAGILFFPSFGRRGWSNGQIAMSNVEWGVFQSHAVYWTAQPWVSGNFFGGLILWFSKGNTATVRTDLNGRANGYSVRPIVDE